MPLLVVLGTLQSPFSLIILVNPHSKPSWEVLLPTFRILSNWNLEKISGLTNFLQFVGSWLTEISCPQCSTQSGTAQSCGSPGCPCVLAFPWKFAWRSTSLRGIHIVDLGLRESTWSKKLENSGPGSSSILNQMTSVYSSNQSLFPQANWNNNPSRPFSSSVHSTTTVLDEKQ